jgi:D-alanyl-lipoteichoic acid acyltransferase DltB (MBOAT superfamily)
MYLILAIILSLLAILSTRLKKQKVISAIPYLFFFICPILTYFGVISVLTGFDNIYTSSIYFGISFYTVNIGYYLLKSREAIKSRPFIFLLFTINPLYLFTGPFPNEIPNKLRKINFKLFFKRLEIINSELILGVFFALILAPSFLPLFYLKNSFEFLDIILFGIIFEFYVYFNFAGFSMIAWSFMRLIGINVQRNFNQPFSSTSIVEYWQRWHITLSNILKELFFKKIKVEIGLYGTVFIVFCASALWHGITINFLIWGATHSLFWCISNFLYKKKMKVLNYLLLFFGVIIGRIIFSEMNTAFLLKKMRVLIDFTQWNFKISNNFYFMKLGYSNLLNIYVSLFLIFLETPDKNYYSYLKTPIVSTIILIYLFLTINGFNFEPIYGGR